MSDTRCVVVNLYDDVWTEDEIARVVGQMPAFTLDGNIVDDNPTALIRSAAYEGGDLILEIQTPEGVYADDLGGDSPHPITLGYLRGADGLIRVHTIARYDQVPPEDPMPVPPGYQTTSAPGEPMEVSPRADVADEA